MPKKCMKRKKVKHKVKHNSKKMEKHSPCAPFTPNTLVNCMLEGAMLVENPAPT